MIHQEILEKAISKAIKGGWNEGKEIIDLEVNWSLVQNLDWVDNGLKSGWYDYDFRLVFSDIIFNHDFAKALWGTQMTLPPGSLKIGDTVTVRPNWQHHLQQIVIADDPIAYLGSTL